MHLVERHAACDMTQRRHHARRSGAGLSQLHPTTLLVCCAHLTDKGEIILVRSECLKLKIRDGILCGVVIPSDRKNIPEKLVLEK